MNASTTDSSPSSDSMFQGGAIKTQHIVEWIFVILQVVGGHIGLLLLLCTFIVMQHRTLKRCVVVNNFCFTWMFSSICYCLLLYTGRSDPSLFVLNPSSDRLCLAQASLINGVQALTSVSTFGLIVNLWLTFNRPHLYCTTRSKKIVKGALVTVSWVAFWTFFIAAFVLGSKPAIVVGPSFDVPVTVAPNLAAPTSLYCVIVENGPVSNSVTGPFRILLSAYIFSVIMYGITFLIEVQILWSISTKRSTYSLERAAYKETFVRVLIFSVYRLMSLIMLALIVRSPITIFLEGLSSKLTKFEAFSEIVQAGVPLVAFLVLGTRKDVLLTWGVRRHQLTGASTYKPTITFRSEKNMSLAPSPRANRPQDSKRNSQDSSLLYEKSDHSHNVDSIVVGSAYTDEAFRPLEKTLPSLPPPVVQKKSVKISALWKKRPW